MQSNLISIRWMSADIKGRPSGEAGKLFSNFHVSLEFLGQSRQYPRLQRLGRDSFVRNCQPSGIADSQWGV